MWRNYKRQLATLVIPAQRAGSPRNPFLFLPHRLAIAAKISITVSISEGITGFNMLVLIIQRASNCGLDRAAALTMMELNLRIVVS